MNSFEAISVRKWAPPILRASICELDSVLSYLGSSRLTQQSLTFKVASWMFGFLCPIRRFKRSHSFLRLYAFRTDEV